MDLKTEKKTGRIPGILSSIPVYMLAAFIFFVLFASFIWRAEYCGYRYGDKPAWNHQDCLLLSITLMLLGFCFVLIYKMGVLINHFNRKPAVASILYISFIVQVIFILYLPTKQFADQHAVNQIALEVLNGNFTAFKKGGYLYQFPNNVGITLLLSLVYSVFPHSLLVPKFLNVAFSTLTSYLTFRIYEELCPEKKNKYGVLLLASFFLPMILLNNLIYNDIMAATLFAGLVCYAARFAKTRKWPYLIPTTLLTAAGNFLRQVGVIFLIAITLYFFIKKMPPLRILAFFGLALILLRLPLAVVNACLIRSGKIEEPLGLNSIPIHMWINIGMNEGKYGYWDDGKSWRVYIREGQWNKAKSSGIYSELIKKNIEKNGLLGIARIYAAKNIWLWTEGTYQAEYYGIGSWGYLYPTAATRLFDRNILLRDCVRWILHATNTLLLTLAGAGLIRALLKREAYCLLLPAIILIGFICFYTVWEIKPRYIYMTYPYLVHLAYYGLDSLLHLLIRLIKRLRPVQPESTAG